MERVAHNPSAAGRLHIPQSVGQEFSEADRGRHFANARGGTIRRALSVVDSAHRQHRAFGGVDTLFSRQDIRQEEAPVQGFLGGDTLGRADGKNASVTSGAYVLPADVIAGLGEGNSLAGANLTQKWLSTGPYGTPLPPQRRGSGPPGGSPPRAPMGTRLPQLQYEKGGGTPIKKGDQSPVPVALSDGEFVIAPEIVAHHADLGALDPNDHNPKHYEAALKRGHDILDHLVLELRKRHLAETARLPKPAK